MKTLYLRIEDDWPHHPACDWILVDVHGNRMEQGRSEPPHWPVADRQCAVLSGAQVTLHRVVLPNVGRREREQALRFALEERLPGDVEQTHLTALHWGDGAAIVAVIDRQRLRSLLATFDALLRPVSSAYSLLQFLPADDDTWGLTWAPAGWLLRRGDSSGLFVAGSDSGSPPPLLPLALKEAERVDKAPRELCIHVDGQPVHDELDAAWSLPVRQVAWFPWSSMARGVSLLQGDFSPPAQRVDWLARFRPALLVIGAAIIIHLLASAGDLIHGRSELASRQQRMRTVFQGVFPQAAIVDPVLQMRRQLNMAQARHGELQDHDFLALLGVLATVLGSDADDCVQELRYDGEQLEVALRLPEALPAAALAGKLALAGVQSTPKEPGEAGVWRAVLRRGAT